MYLSIRTLVMNHKIHNETSIRLQSEYAKLKFHHNICDESFLSIMLSSLHFSSKEKNNKNSAQILGNEVKTDQL